MFVATLINWTKRFWSQRFKLLFDWLVLKSQRLFFFSAANFLYIFFTPRKPTLVRFLPNPTPLFNLHLSMPAYKDRAGFPLWSPSLFSKLFTVFNLAFGTGLLVVHTAFVTEFNTSSIVLKMALDLRSSWSFAACFCGKCFHYYFYFLLQLDEASVFGNGISPD